ncbi:methionyl-tRNA formyltransferase [Pseudomonas sp. GX19020]|uniref:methionyl-tRNA formyltransferase n=1 Tax=Pseudomonadota TaxID=1224 RepID=UPI0008954C34|nr:MULTISPECIES: methionyl-tRNA formyltransferase [Pseudomonadota]MCL4065778.1 methionyl-tRNA formyltransferase [Pseudomonas sp. GX19020]SEC02221.1 methionyl-tRNA formyltransferase [Rhodobacter sp. 24-YEA-8]
MRIAIIGQQAFGKAVLEAFLARGDDVAAVFCAPEKPGAKPDPLRLAAEEKGVKTLQLPNLTSEAAAEALRALDVDLAVMAYVLQFAPQGFVTIPKHGAICYHPSLLPKYRGPSAISWPLIRGETETGLTIFRPNDGLDEGDIVLQKTTAVSADDTLGTVYFDRLFPMGVAAMLEAADLILAGKHSETVQDESQATYEGWCRDPEARINWSAHAIDIHNLIRGCDPAPGAWMLVGDEKIRIYESHLIPARRFADVKGKPGTIAAIGGGKVQVALQGGLVEIGRVRTAQGEKLSAADYASRLGLAIGDRIDSHNAGLRTAAE